jgi:putative ABC transport system permease protein
MSRSSFRWSRTLYRILLRAYPREFRDRFAHDLVTDFDALLASRGQATAWSRTAADLVRSLQSTHAHARAMRRRHRAIAYQGEGTMSSLLFDLRHALRTLLKAPVFTTVTILTLALGIGANSAMFSLVNAALLRPLGYDDPERLVLVHEGIPQAGLPKLPGSAPDIIDIRQYQRSFSRLAAFTEQTMELSGLGQPERLTAVRVEPEIFPLLGVEPMVGRTFAAEEDRPGVHVAVLGYPLWQRLFGGRPDAIGSVVRLDRRAYTIVGVMPASFEFPKRGPIFNATPADVWIPMAWSDAQKGARGRGSMFNNSILGRLKPGVSFEQASAELTALGPRVRENYPPILKNSPYQLEIAASPLRDEIAGQIRTPLLVLFAAVGLVLLVACANVANLILSRAASRQRELNVRLALGAPRARLLQLLLCESLALALTGGLLGLAAARIVLDAVPAVLSTGLPGLQDVALDARVVTFTLGVSMLTAVIFGLVPMFTSDRDVSAALHDGSARTAGGSRGHRIQQALVTVTVGLAVVLLVGAGLLVRSFAALMATDPGFRAHQVLTMSVALPIDAYASGRSVGTFARALHDRLRSIPGVRGASLSTDVPLESNERRAMTPESTGEAAASPSVALSWTVGDYFGTLGVPIRRGRTFTSAEDDEFRPVAIVSESLAATFWPGQDPIGKRIKNGLRESRRPWLEIVGVAGDAHDGPLTNAPTIHVYVPFSHIVPDLDQLGEAGSGFGRTLRIALLAHGDPAALVTPARAQIAQLDAALPVTRIATMEQQVTESMAPQSFSTAVLAAFAAGALLLAAIGLYGVLAFAVAQRTREIGVRIALGASRGSVLGMVVRQGMLLVAAGLAIGLAGAVGVTRVMTTLLYRTQPFDPWTFAAVPVVLATVALLACYLPARRAARVEPMVALRTE